MLLNGRFHIDPVTGPRAVLLAWRLLYWPEAESQYSHPMDSTTARELVTGPIWKHLFHDIFNFVFNV